MGLDSNVANCLDLGLRIWSCLQAGFAMVETRFTPAKNINYKKVEESGEKPQ
jgi:hypothetical protein